MAHFAQIRSYYLVKVDISAADYAALLGTQSLTELVGTADAMQKGLRVWMLIPNRGKHYLLTSESYDGFDHLVEGQVAAIAIPLIFGPVTPTDGWAKGLFNLLQWQEDWIKATRQLMPVWEEGRLLAIVGATSGTSSSGVEDIVRFVAAAVRKIDQVGSARRDAVAAKELLLHPDKSSVVATYRGKVITGTQGGMAIVNNLLGRDRLLACREEPVLPDVLHAAIVKGESLLVVDDLQVRISCIIQSVPTTIDPAFTLVFSRHLKAADARSAEKGFEALSPAERRLLPSILAGKQNKEISAELHLSLSTVKRHLEHILQKCQCPNRLVLMARMGQTAAVLKPQPFPGLSEVNLLPPPVRKMSDAA